MPPHLYILCGLPFAGKSTLARKLAQQLPCVHLETDALNTELGYGLAGAPISEQQWAATYRAAHQRLDTLLRAGQCVVFDATNGRRVQRERLRQIAKRYAAATTVILVTTTQETARARLYENRVRRVRNDVRDEDFALVAARFQVPTEDESVVPYATTWPLMIWLEQVLKHTGGKDGLRGG